MALHVLTREQLLAAPPEEAFGLFADALHLEAITPPWLGFRVVHAGADRDGRATLMRDTVRYAMPPGLLGEIARRAVVGRDLERIFDFRRDEVARRVAERAGAPSFTK